MVLVDPDDVARRALLHHLVLGHWVLDLGDAQVARFALQLERSSLALELPNFLADLPVAAVVVLWHDDERAGAHLFDALFDNLSRRRHASHRVRVVRVRRVVRMVRVVRLVGVVRAVGAVRVVRRMRRVDRGRRRRRLDDGGRWWIVD